MSDHPHVRTMLACPKCSQPKERGLLLCRPCHRLLKSENGGGYGEGTEKLLAALEGEIA